MAILNIGDTTVPLILLGVILGLPAILIVLTANRLIYIFWMFIYLLSLPVWNFVLPLYAFWHFDDFSWGETRKTSGDVKGEDHSNREGEFDSSGIQMKRWSDWVKVRRVEAHRAEMERLASLGYPMGNNYNAFGAGFGPGYGAPMYAMPPHPNVMPMNRHMSLQVGGMLPPNSPQMAGGHGYMMPGPPPPGSSLSMFAHTTPIGMAMSMSMPIAHPGGVPSMNPYNLPRTPSGLSHISTNPNTSTSHYNGNGSATSTLPNLPYLPTLPTIPYGSVGGALPSPHSWINAPHHHHHQPNINLPFHPNVRRMSSTPSISIQTNNLNHNFNQMMNSPTMVTPTTASGGGVATATLAVDFSPNASAHPPLASPSFGPLSASTTQQQQQQQPLKRIFSGNSLKNLASGVGGNSNSNNGSLTPLIIPPSHYNGMGGAGGPLSPPVSASASVSRLPTPTSSTAPSSAVTAPNGLYYNAFIGSKPPSPVL
jgi:hypothetical protein